MDEFTKYVDKHFEVFWNLRDEYDKTFGRYIIVGSGAGIGLILSFLKDKTSTFDGFLSFDTAVWLFTFAILLSGLCTFLIARLSHNYAQSFASMSGYLMSQTKNESLENLFENDVFKELASTKTLNWLHVVILGVQLFSGVLFSTGLVMAIFIATRIL